MAHATAIRFAKADTVLIRKTLNYTTDKHVRVSSEATIETGRLVKFWWYSSPMDMVEVNAKLRAAFGDRFISCCYTDRKFEVQLKPFA